MKKLLIKVCGLTAPDNIRAITALQTDMLGFIFYPPSPRYIRDKTPGDAIRLLAEGKKKVGVFVDESVAKAYDTAMEYGLNAIQLHGRETPEHCQLLRIKFTLIKAFPIAIAADFEQTKDYGGACDYFLFDTKGPNHGGNGFAFNWNMLDNYTGETPFLLSGGIHPEDAMKIGQLQHPKLAGLDLNSRFETSPGLKSVPAVEQFISTLNGR